MTEPFFEGQRECEFGKAWDTFAYGGHFDIYTDTDTDEEAFQTLQYGLVFSLCDNFRNKKDSAIVGVKPRKFLSDYAVPMDFIQKRFTEQFWSVDVKKLGLKAFEVPRIFGSRKLNPDWTDDMSDGTPSRDPSRERYPDKNGIIRQEPQIMGTGTNGKARTMIRMSVRVMPGTIWKDQSSHYWASPRILGYT